MADDGVTSGASALDSYLFIRAGSALTNASFIDLSHSDQLPVTSLPVLVLKIVAMAVIILLAVLGNLLVIVSVLLHRRIRVVANYFVVSLALADMLVALCAMTFNASIQITGHWQFGYVMCDVWNSFDVFFSTVSILHLCCISVDRYFAILRPLEYRTQMSKRIVAAMLALCWTAPIGISFIPIFLGWYSTREHLQYRAQHPNTCQFIVNEVYMIVSSCVSFWIPGVIMICMYSRIYQEAKKQHRAISRTPSTLNFPASDCIVHLDSITEEQLAMALTALKNISEEAGEVQVTSAGDNGGPTSCSSADNGTMKASSSATVPWRFDRSTVSSVPPPPSSRDLLAKKSSTVSFFSGDSSTEHQGRASNTSRLFRMRSSTSNMLREHKAAKTLGVIMGCFVLCWLPFFTWYATATLCGSFCDIPPVLVDVLFWIGYFNSTLNPMIYAYFNTEFRDAYRETLALLICCGRLQQSSFEARSASQVSRAERTERQAEHTPSR